MVGRRPLDNLQRYAEWDVIVRYNPLERRYSATRIEGDRATSLGSSDAMKDIDAALGKPFTPAIAAPKGGNRYYWICTLDVEMLSVNDLDEVERWLHGELTPAVHGERQSRNGDRTRRHDAHYESSRRQTAAL